MARKEQALSDAIERGDGKSAKTIAYNAILEGVTATERTSFEDALTMNDSYDKVQTALADFKKAGLETGLTGNTMSEIYKNLTIKRPDEAIKLKTRLEQSFNAYRKAVTGAGASEGELKMLSESMPTFNKNLSEIEIMTNLIQKDARDSLDRKVGLLTKGAFDNYDDMQVKLNKLAAAGEEDLTYGDFTLPGNGKGTINSTKHISSPDSL